MGKVWAVFIGFAVIFAVAGRGDPVTVGDSSRVGPAGRTFRRNDRNDLGKPVRISESNNMTECGEDRIPGLEGQLSQ